MQGIIEKKNRTNKTNALFKMREIVMSDWQKLKNLCMTAVMPLSALEGAGGNALVL